MQKHGVTEIEGRCFSRHVRTWISSVLVTTVAPVALAILLLSVLRSLGGGERDGMKEREMGGGERDGRWGRERNGRGEKWGETGEEGSGY